MSYAHLFADGFGVKLNNEGTHEDEKKSFAKEIAEKNKEIREQHRVIIQESVEDQAPALPKSSKNEKNSDKNVS